MALAVWLWVTPWDPVERLAGLWSSDLRHLKQRFGQSSDVAPRVSEVRRALDAATESESGGRGPEAVREALTLAATALGGVLFVGGWPGPVVGIAVGVVVVVIRRRRMPGDVRGRQQRIIADLPYALDLMVACLRAGQPVGGAVEATAQAIRGPLGESLARVNGRLRLGASPESAWQVLESDRPLAALARGMTRAALSGAPVADVLARLADDARQESRTASSAAARRVGVQVVAPLGLCFLPAFVFLGIIPVVAGLAAQVFPG
ncbi:type II secretion system F family protein [Sphaerisporangium album]|uniref:Type II secretion system F family protein n=2 Tax=Sphaerisporangium album TaxID=509200 RepID=A0A367FKJ7_9ACTN|nr:type II secretion system F family protein [Sphaerisporangium album]